MHIVVVGAGIAGLVAAGAAHRAGHRVTALERSAPGSAAGAGISLWGNALRALDAIPATQPASVSPGESDASGHAQPRSLGQRVRAIGGAPRAGSPAGIRTPSGRWLVRTPVGERGELGPGSEVAVVHRADLQRVLTDQLPRSAIRYESVCLGVDQQPDGASVTWHGPDGETSATADWYLPGMGCAARCGTRSGRTIRVCGTPATPAGGGSPRRRSISPRAAKPGAGENVSVVPRCGTGGSTGSPLRPSR